MQVVRAIPSELETVRVWLHPSWSRMIGLVAASLAGLSKNTKPIKTQALSDNAVT